MIVIRFLKINKTASIMGKVKLFLSYNNFLLRDFFFQEGDEMQRHL